MFRLDLGRRVAVVSLLALVSATGCQGLADAITSPTVTGSSKGTITFWTNDSSPSPISVSVDGTPVGLLTAYRVSAPTCGAATSDGTLTVSVSAGTHTMSARETTAAGHWGPATFTVDGGGCLTYVLNP
jgi:Cu/Zn superoxide dismutase